MSLDHRERLVRLARQYDALLVTDDVYDFLQWSAIPGGKLANPEHACLPRLVDVDRYLDGGPVDEWGHAISNGSFSKLLGPGARTGWAEASEKVAYGLSQVYVSCISCLLSLLFRLFLFVRVRAIYIDYFGHTVFWAVEGRTTLLTNTIFVCNIHLMC